MAITQIRGANLGSNSQIKAGTISTADLNASAGITDAQLANGSLFLKSDGSVSLGANLALGGNKITGLGTPTSGTDAATKDYVDSTATGLDVKASVRAATTGAITLSGTQTVDGVSLSVGNRVLVKDQADQTTNGIYVVASGSWTRATDADQNAEVTPGLFTFVEEGTVNADSGFVLSTTGTITLGSSNLTFVQFSGAGEITNGAGLSKSGNTLAVVVDNSSIEINANTLRIKAGGVTNAMLAGSIAASKLIGTDIATVGTITAGTWQGNAIGDTWISSASTWNSKAASGANTDITSVLLNQTGLVVKGASSNALTIKPNETLSAGRTLNLILNDATRTLTISADATVSGTNSGDQTITLTSDVTGSGTGSFATTIAAAAVTLSKMATVTSGNVIGNSGSGNAYLPFDTAATASAIAKRNSSANLLANNFVPNLRTQATAAGTTTLVVGDAYLQQFTGSTTQTVVLPDATTLTVGHSFLITNRSSGTVTVNANGGGLVKAMAASSQAIFTAVTVGTSAGTWDVAYSITNAGAGGGTVTSVSIASANGFTGTSDGNSATPALTIATSVTGVLKGNGTAISAATQGSDYVANSNFIVRETPSGSVNSSNVTFTLANTPTSGTEQVYLNGMLQEPGAGNDYTISGAVITYLTAPVTGDRLRVSYMK